jgi:acyl carrier protein
MKAPHIVERDILEILTAAIAAELDSAATVDPDTVFTDLGLDSAGVMVVAGDLEDALGVPVPVELLFDYPTPRQLAAHLATAPGPAPHG